MLGQVARKRGLIKPGGIANIEEAARSVLRDYQSGKIPYFTAPPTTLDGSDSDMQD
jgi:nuclear GTP-binding protein